MTTVAIICEYNPFHNGHKYQIDKIREEFGEDTRIIAIMSGNYTQRGEIAIADKGLRARCAVDCGVNLVLELPFPFSISSAELFARAGVVIADRIGVVDFLSFGSECGDILQLRKSAEAMLTDEYRKAISELKNNKDSKKLGYAELCERALLTVNKANSPVPFTPNNILALEYIKALTLLNSSVKPHTVKREGAAYSEAEIIESRNQSASAIRSSVLKGDISALEFMPKETKSIILDAIKNGEFPTNVKALSSAVISSFRLNSSSAPRDIHDAKDGLYNRLRANSFEANDIDTLISLTETKKYTNARIRRVIWYSYFGVTSSEVKEAPAYTQVLAMDAVGRTMLKEIGKRSSFPILTKPSATGGISESANEQRARACRADSVFQLTKPTPPSGDYAVKFTPYVKK